MTDVFSKVSETKVVRNYCPLVKGDCRRGKCMLHLASGHCAIAVIAMRLDALIEGVPVIRLYKEG